MSFKWTNRGIATSTMHGKRRGLCAALRVFLAQSNVCCVEVKCRNGRYVHFSGTGMDIAYQLELRRLVLRLSCPPNSRCRYLSMLKQLIKPVGSIKWYCTVVKKSRHNLANKKFTPSYQDESESNKQVFQKWKHLLKDTDIYIYIYSGQTNNTYTQVDRPAVDPCLCICNLVYYLLLVYDELQEVASTTVQIVVALTFIIEEDHFFGQGPQARTILSIHHDHGGVVVGSIHQQIYQNLWHSLIPLLKESISSIFQDSYGSCVL